jgi:pimeloyl-ACP methyl ester carboxylesterase
MTTPGVGAVVARMPAPPSAAAARRAFRGAAGRPAVDALPDEWFDALRHTMKGPGWRRAMRSHLRLALRGGRARPENLLTDEELGRLATPVLFVWGESDVYGPPDIGRRAAAVMPDARVETMPGGHAPFLDDPAHVARLVTEFLRRDAG